MASEAFELILSNAKEKFESQEELTSVEKVVLREYITVLRARLSQLQLKSQRYMLSDVEYARMQGLDSEILKYQGVE